MKLNLLPATVSKGRQSRSAWVVFFLIVVASIVAAVFISIDSKKALDRQNARLDEVKPAAEKALEIANKADEIVGLPLTKALVNDTALAKAMIAHNTVYPDLYDSLRPYIPKFFRVISMTAAPIDDKTCTVTMQGTITSYQQYADLMLALLRNKDVVTVARQGYISQDPFVPNVTPYDQTGRPHKPNEGTVPDEPLQRLAYFQALPKPSGFLNVGNYGSGTTAARYATPTEALITVTEVVKRNLQVPIPRSWLTSSGGGGAPATPLGMGGPGMGGPPGMGGFGPPGGMPGGPGMGTPSADTGAAGAGSKRGGKNAASDD